MLLFAYMWMVLLQCSTVAEPIKKNKKTVQAEIMMNGAVNLCYSKIKKRISK